MSHRSPFRVIVGHADEATAQLRARGSVIGAVVADSLTSGEFTAPTIATLQTLKAGGSVDGGAAPATEVQVLAKLVPVVAHLAGHRDLLHVSVRCASSVPADNLVLITYFVRVLEASVLGTPLADAFAVNLTHLEQPLRAAVESALKAAHEDGAAADAPSRVAHFGSEANLASVVPAAAYLALRAGGDAGSFEKAVQGSVSAGGAAVAERTFLVGALLGAARAAPYGAPAAAAAAVDPAAGLSWVPAAWLDALASKAELLALSFHSHEPVHSGVATDHVVAHPSATKIVR